MDIFNLFSPHFVTFTLSKPGRRTKNEDYLQFKKIKNERCWVVADGLGGHLGGDIASQIAVNSIMESFLADHKVSVQCLEKHIQIAQQEILKYNDLNSCAIHTTVVVLLLDTNSFIWGYVGDSRLYVFRSGKIVIQTEDHSLSQALVNIGEIKLDELRHHEDRNKLLRALGMKGDLRPSLVNERVPWQRGDVFLLCTDGFWENVTEEELERELSLSSSPNQWLSSMEKILLGRAQSNQDNYTAVAVFV